MGGREQQGRHLTCLDSGAPGGGEKKRERERKGEYFLWSKSNKDSILFFHI